MNTPGNRVLASAVFSKPLSLGTVSSPLRVHYQYTLKRANRAKGIGHRVLEPVDSEIGKVEIIPLLAKRHHAGSRHVVNKTGNTVDDVITRARRQYRLTRLNEPSEVVTAWTNYNGAFVMGSQRYFRRLEGHVIIIDIDNLCAMLKIRCMPYSPFYLNNKTIANLLTKKHQRPFINMVISGTAKTRFDFKAFSITQKRENTTFALYGKKRV